MRNSRIRAALAATMLWVASAAQASNLPSTALPLETEVTETSRVQVLNFYASYNVQMAKEYAEAGQIGFAKLHLERARWLRPFDIEIQRGLKIINWHVQHDRMERFPDARLTQGEPRTLWTWRLFNSVPTRIWAWTLLASVWISCGLLMLRRAMRKSLRRDAVAIGAILSIVVAVCAMIGWIGCVITGSTLRPAVVVGSRVMAWSAPDAMVTPQNNPDLYEGAVVVVRTEDGDWAELQLSDAERVWTKRDNIRQISAHRDSTLRVD